MTFYTPTTPEIDRFIKNARDITPYVAEINLIQYLSYDPPHPAYCAIGETKQCTCSRDEVIVWAKEESVAQWLGRDPT